MLTAFFLINKENFVFFCVFYHEENNKYATNPNCFCIFYILYNVNFTYIIVMQNLVLSL